MTQVEQIARIQRIIYAKLADYNISEAAPAIHTEVIRPLVEREAALREALTPSAETKAAYIGEFSFTVVDRDDEGEEIPRRVLVPWDTTKEIMAAILARTTLSQEPQG